MKTRNIIKAIGLTIALFTERCEYENHRITGLGSITTEILSVPEFTGIAMIGVDHVHISYGTSQKVEVEGHKNIFDRIKTRVVIHIWNIELERGNYVRYELRYYITLPYLDYANISGTGDIIIESAFDQDDIKVMLEGTGDFRGFSMSANSCYVYISGTSNCETTATDYLDARLSGMGNVY